MENLGNYNFNSLETGEMSTGQVQDLMKAMSATQQTGRDLDGQDTAGSALKVESLDPTLKILTNQDQHIVFWKMIAKEKAYNTVEEYNQLVDYGGNVGIFNTEGETPQFTDSNYRRQSALVKYMGISGEVTHPFTLVNLGSGVGNAIARQVQDKTQFLLRGINKSLSTGDSGIVENEFDGIFKQHYLGVAGTGVAWDTYFGDSSVIDVRGKALNDDDVESAAQSVVNDNFGMVSTIMGAPTVFSNYVKRFHESKRIVPGVDGSVSGATMGQSVNKIQTQFGAVDVKNDIFFDADRRLGRTSTQAATSNKSPNQPNAGGNLNAVVDAGTKFNDGAGDYWYAVTAKNRFGESAIRVIDDNAITVGANQSVDITFTQTDGNFAAESFVIYRTEKGATSLATAKFYPILYVSAAQHTAGYDGGGAGVVRDKNRFIPNTSSAIVTEFSTQVMSFKQLAPMMRMDLARTAPAYRFMVLCYGTPVVYAPKKISRIVNIGADIS